MASIDAVVQSVKFDDSAMPYFQLALAFFVIEYTLHTYLDWRQLQTIRTCNPPEDLKDHYTADHITQTRAYSVDKKTYALVHGAFGAAESFAVLWYQLLPQLWDFATDLTSMMRPAWAKDEIIVTIVFVLFTSILTTIQEIPWSLYYTFVLEEKHGFNKTTLSLFVTDTIKSTALTLVLTPPIVAAITWILLNTGPYLALYMWAFVMVLQMVVMTVYPTLIAPLFNKYDPLPTGTLREGIEELAGALSFPLKKLFVMDGSKRSGHSNAYMYGFFNNKRIVIYDTLIAQCTEGQVVAVLAHELGHWKLSHTLCLMLIGQATLLLQFGAFTLIRASPTLFGDFGFTGAQPVIMALVLFQMVMTPVDSLLHYMNNIISRRFEFQADGFAVGMDHGENLIEALKALDGENKSDFVVDPWYSAYNYSHPPLVERLRAVKTGLATRLAKMK